jgi:two-component system, cell cycle sensor histidine kinase and response regulator CckA
MAAQVHDSPRSRARSICRSVLDAIIDAILLFDPQTFRIVDANKKATEIYGFPRKELLTKRLHDLTNDVPTYADIVHPPPGMEATHFNRHGEKLEFSVSLCLIEYWGQKAVLSINRDVREIKRIQANISANEKKFRFLIQNISEIVALVDSLGLVSFMSPQAERVLGLSAEETIGHSVFDFIHPAERVRARAEYEKTVREPGEAVPSILRFRDAEGKWVPFEIIANNQIHEPDVRGVIFTARDLRYRRELEDAVRRSNEELDRRVQERTMELARANAALRLENRQRNYTERQLQQSLSLLNATLESTADGILVISTDRTVRSFNRKFLEMWRIPESSLANMSDEDLLRWATPQMENPDEFLEGTAALYAAPEETSLATLRLKDGRVFERFSQPQKVGSKITGRVWSFRDVTQSEWLQQELLQAQKMDAVGRLAGGVAHDFNNVLMLISGYVAQLRQEPGLSEAALSLAEQLGAATKRAAALTHQLLAFSRKHPVTPQVLDLNAVLLELEKVLPRLLAAPIRLNMILQPQGLHICADRAQIELMVVNLALNARDAMPQGGTLTISTRGETLDLSTVPDAGASSRYAVIEVNDTGHGMTSTVSARIFEPFFTTKEIGKGTGLGLSTVYGIVEQAGGHITVESEPELGTTFRVYFPNVSAPLALADAKVEEVPPKGDETILLVEDEEGIRTMTRMYLQNLGYTVLEAPHGADALRISREHSDRIDLLLTDILMPGMKGDELARVLAAERPEMITVFISGFTNLHELDPNIKVVEKPFDFPDLGRAVREALDANKVQAFPQRRAS